MNKFFKWLELLSLDAVVVAVCWGIALAQVVGRYDCFWDIVILALATWLTYVADRLWQVRPGRTVPDTDRHLYYRDRYKFFTVLWLILLPATILLAIVFLPDYKLAWGWLIVSIVMAYLWTIDRISNHSILLLIKRTIVPVIFTTGVVWMSGAWRTSQGIVGSVLLLAGALSNLLLITCWENNGTNRPKWLAMGTAFSLIFLLACAHAALFFNLSLGLAGLICSGGYFILFIQIKTSRARQVRTWADMTLAISAIPVVLMIWIPG